MKTILTLFATAAIFTLISCNNPFKSSEPIVMKYTTHKEALDTLRKNYLASLDTAGAAAKDVPVVFLGPDNILFSADSAKDFLSNVDIAKLVNSKEENSNYANIYNGFFGADRYRIEFYFSDVSRDSANPAILSVMGKTRFKKNIIPFKGTISIDSVLQFRNPLVAKFWPEYAKGEAKSYHLSGKFELAEEAGSWGAGKYKGQFYMDISINENGESDYWYYNSNEINNEAEFENKDQYDSLKNSFVDLAKPTRGAGFLFDGNWSSNSNSTLKPLLLAKDIFMFGNDILEHFSYGERDIEIDPKYKELGWDNYWENDEWYNDANAKVMMMFP